LSLSLQDIIFLLKRLYRFHYDVKHSGKFFYRLRRRNKKIKGSFKPKNLYRRSFYAKSYIKKYKGKYSFKSSIKKYKGKYSFKSSIKRSQGKYSFKQLSKKSRKYSSRAKVNIYRYKDCSAVFKNFRRFSQKKIYKVFCY